MLERVVRLNADYARAINDDRLEDWPGFFTEKCLYKITSADNHRRGLEAGVIYADTNGMLRDRVAALREANIYERQAYRHLVGLPALRPGDDGVVSAETPFLVVRVMRDGTMDLFATGRYVDVMVDEGGALNSQDIGDLIAFIQNGDFAKVRNTLTPDRLQSLQATTQALGGPPDPNAPPGKTLFLSKGCVACHTIEGVSAGTVGPNLDTRLRSDCATPQSKRIRGATLKKCIYTAIINPYVLLTYHGVYPALDIAIAATPWMLAHAISYIQNN